jgi:hypothetical protein
MLLKSGTPHREVAIRFLDYLTSTEVQQNNLGVFDAISVVGEDEYPADRRVVLNAWTHQKGALEEQTAGVSSAAAPTPNGILSRFINKSPLPLSCIVDHHDTLSMTVYKPSGVDSHRTRTDSVSSANRLITVAIYEGIECSRCASLDGV